MTPATSEFLDKWAKIYGIERLPEETDELLRSRLMSKLKPVNPVKIHSEKVIHQSNMKKMNMYLIMREYYPYDSHHLEYYSIVVAAETEDDARKIHPQGDHYRWKQHVTLGESSYYKEWVNTADIKHLKVKYLGEAKKGQKHGVILASHSCPGSPDAEGNMIF